MNLSRINTRVVEKKISKTALAKAIDVSPQGLNKMIARNDCMISDLLKISKILDVDIFYFFQDEIKISMACEPSVTYGKQAEMELLKELLKEKDEIIQLQKEKLKQKETKHT